MLVDQLSGEMVKTLRELAVEGPVVFFFPGLLSGFRYTFTGLDYQQ